MSLPPPPPPPPMIASKAKAPHPSSDSESDANKAKCYETVPKMQLNDVLAQVRQSVLMEISTLVPEEEPFGMLIVMTPILEPILQCGPVYDDKRCGLIALVEAARLKQHDLNPDFILEEARRLGVTKNGEMFCIRSMQTLVREYLKTESRILDTNDTATVQELVKTCLKGNPALIPYDADYNHSPSLRKGHAAHWAVIHGIAMRMQLPKMLELTKSTGCSENVAIIEPQELINYPRLEQEVISEAISDTLYVIAHQGKSLRTGIWKYTDLVKSNQNLNEISPKLTSSSEQFVLTDIKSGLSSKLLVLD